ncbi:MAG: tetratricopeptide repeat protein [bacterium]|nr:tetratricopeptide repeat protein [bacterium]
MPRRAAVITLIALVSVGLLFIYPAFSQTAKETAVLGEMRLLHEQTRSAAEKATSEAQWAKEYTNTGYTLIGLILGLGALIGGVLTLVHSRRIRDLTEDARHYLERTESYQEKAANITDKLEKRREDIEESINAQVAQAIETIKAEVDKAVKAEVEQAIGDLERREKEAVEAIDEERDQALEFSRLMTDGNREADQENFEVALRAYDQAIAIYDESPTPWTNKGIVLNKLGRPDEALEAHLKVIELDPDNEYGLYNIACTYSLLGQKPEMLDALSRVIELVPVWKKSAQTDEDFDPYRDDPDFQEIVGDEEEPSEG